MDSTAIKKILDQALTDLFDNQPNILEFTSETHQSEWNLSHHYANEVHKYFSEHGYNCDLDIIKPNFDNKRPDIIIHKRTNHESNLLVIEVKYMGRSTHIESDKEKIKQFWFCSPLNYKFGAVVNIDSPSNSTAEVFDNQS